MQLLALQLLLRQNMYPAQPHPASCRAAVRPML